MTREQLVKLAEESVAMKLPRFLEGLERINSEYGPRDDPYYRFLWWLVVFMQPQLLVDLGTCEGVSAMCLAEGNPKGVVVSIDRDPVKLCREILRPNVQYLTYESTSPLGDEIKPVDLLDR